MHKYIHIQRYTSIHPLFHGFIHHPLVSSAHLTFSRVSVLCLPFQNVYFLVTPFLYIVQPFLFWSSSFCFPFHLPEHHLLCQSAVFHSTYVPKISLISVP